jgi:hypothetical protein
MSLVTLVPKWSGTETAIPITRFFDVIEGAATMGNWTDADRVGVWALKLTDTAGEFYDSNPDFRQAGITWQELKTRFLQRFRDVRTDQYHYSELHKARQKKKETPQEFYDRVRILARRTVPCTTEPLLQRSYGEEAESRLLAAFTNGLTGTPGRQTRYAVPTTGEDALRIALAVTQAELQEHRNETFHIGVEAADIEPSGRLRELGSSSAGTGVSRTQKPTSQGRQNKSIRCYECSR